MSAVVSSIISRFRREYGHFTAMPPNARKLTVSYFLRSIAYPLIGIFTGAFIWNADHNITLLFLYYIGNFTIAPFIFLLNRFLLRHIRLSTLYGIGTVLTGVSALMVIFYSVHSPTAYLLYGMLYGLGNGLYWANRNFLTLRHTDSDVRAYFTGLQFSLSTIASIVVPVLAGWMIVLLPFGYHIVVITAFALLIAAGIIPSGGDFGHPDIAVTGRKPFSADWRRVRILSVAIGCVDSLIYILPTVLVLMVSDNEGILGTVSSIVAILTTVASYAFGRKYKRRTFPTVFPLMLVAFVLSGIPLLWGISVATVAWYLIVVNIADSIIWIANEPVVMDLQEAEASHTGLPLYSLIIDREWFINSGRVGVLLISLVISLLRPAGSLQVMAMTCGFVALACMLFVKRGFSEKP